MKTSRTIFRTDILKMITLEQSKTYTLTTDTSVCLKGKGVGTDRWYHWSQVKLA